MMASSFTLDAPDGSPIHVHRWTPSGEPAGVVQIAHGMSEHGGRYARLARALTERGFAVYANDHRGHGRSVPEGEEPGHMGEDGFNHAVAVVRALSRRIAEEHAGLPRVLLGHSMGSFFVQRLIGEERRPADAVVLSASNGKPPPIAAVGRYVARLERLRLGPRGKSKLLDALSFRDFNKKFAPNRTDFDWLSRDAAEVDAYVADPLCGFLVTTQTWVDLLDALPGLTSEEHLSRIDPELPIYVFAGTQDAVGDFGRGVRRLVEAYRRAGLKRVELRLYDGGRHEMLHETNAEQVIADLVAWIERTLGRAHAQVA
ncbi:MAG TPA: alpha/beta hydrolase [Sandaracinaceae bacterium]